MLEVVERYTELKPENELEKYISALEQVNGTDSHDGLGNAFEKAWVDEHNMNVVKLFVIMTNLSEKFYIGISESMYMN